MRSRNEIQIRDTIGEMATPNEFVVFPLAS